MNPNPLKNPVVYLFVEMRLISAKYLRGSSVLISNILSIGGTEVIKLDKNPCLYEARMLVGRVDSRQNQQNGRLCQKIKDYQMRQRRVGEGVDSGQGRPHRENI